MIKKESYKINVVGESESPFRGARPGDIDPLLNKPDKDVRTLIYQAVKAQVELCTQAGDVSGAWEAIKKYQDEQFAYAAPLNCFQRDEQNGGCPYIGGHAAFGAIRDAAKWLYDPFYDKKGSSKPAKRHFRKSIQVKPGHIFMYRPTLEGPRISDHDEINGQQPTEEVKGFSRYEAINNPFQFKFCVNINPKGNFESLLKDTKKMEEVIIQAAIHGLGASRSAGYGMWKVIKLEVP